MRNKRLTRILFRHRWFVVSACAAWCLAMASVAYPQGQKPDAQKVEDSLQRLQQWHLNQQDLAQQIFDVSLLARAGATQAIPALKEEFAVTKETSLKLAIASTLFILGEKVGIYWDFLADKAREAVENDAPSILIFDTEGRVVRSQGKLPPEFIAWAKARNLDPAAAAQTQAYELPLHFLYLAKTGDSRGRELLRMGLKSRNLIIQSYAALGLAKLRDKDSIPLIIEAGRTMPLDGTLFVARALLFFDDPRAQSAAEQFISDKQVLEELRSKIRPGADPFSY
jgi:PBS lyase HEAT-like repeat